MSATAKYYSTCEECPLNIFMKCLETEDPRHLIIQGAPEAGELSMAWASLYAEFIDLSEDSEQMYLLHLQRTIKLLALEIYEAGGVAYFLQPQMLPFCEHRFPELLNILKEYDYPHEFTAGSEEYMNALEAIDNRLASTSLQLNMKIKELNAYAAERGLDSFDKNYFHRQLARLARFQGVAIIKPKDITVFEFVILDKEYQQANTKIENEEI